MLLKIKKSWEMAERHATPEQVFLNRRHLAKGLAAGSLMAGSLITGAGITGMTGNLIFQNANASEPESDHDPTTDLYPVTRNEAYKLDRPITPEEQARQYNNFFEFGTHKRISDIAQGMPLRPWTVQFDGLVEEKRTVDFDTLVRAMPLEERLYRHRCVEAWSMAVPWSGFPLAALVAYAKPLASAKYIRMETLADPETMPGLRAAWYPWPYIEGLTLAEATHDLAFMATGFYGKPIPKQNGAPLRLVVPWKYGFKAIKSIVRFTFTEERPVGFWETAQGSEYGFWANVNPEVSHPRWSQATERVLGMEDRVPTLLYNGYAEEVASLYTNLQSEKLFM